MTKPEPAVAKTMGPLVGMPLINKRFAAKGILIRNDTLYWSVTSLMTINDLGVMRKKIGEFGGDFLVGNFERDPLNKYITAITIHVKTKSGSTGLGSVEGKNALPIKHYSGYLIKNGLAIGLLSVPEPLNQTINADYQEAMSFYKQNELTYLSNATSKPNVEQSDIFFSSDITFSRELLEGRTSAVILEMSGVGKSSHNTFLITDLYRNSDLYLNTKKVNVDELNALPFDKFVKVQIKKDKFDRKFVIVFSK
ncbi:hypothetical protein LZG73_10495 [Dyadobacter sp. CY326]|nr:hypothetical protein [Dyadobacter sp. CY326]